MNPRDVEVKIAEPGDPEPDALEWLPAAAETDPTAPFQREVLAALAALRRRDLRAYEGLRVKLKWAGCRVGSLDEAVRAAQRAAKAGGRPHSVPPLAVAGLVVDPKGFPVWCAENASLMLAADDAWQGVLAYDEVAVAVTLLRPIPGSPTPKSSFRPRIISDNDLHWATSWFNRNGFPHATQPTCEDAVMAAAGLNPVNAIREYLEAVEWDGVPRLSGWLPTYLGTADTPYTRAVGRKWLIALVARALQPGCQCDYALVFEGAQGVGKSEVGRILASTAYYGDALPDLRNKDASSYLRGKWLVEIAELSALRRADLEHIKAFLTRRTEDFRAAYTKLEVREPRRCGFVGTTNRTDYLRDPTGNRRFWPVRVGTIDTEGLKRDRDQLWAEAMQAWQDGEPWFLGPDVERLAAAEQAARAPDDPWASAATDYLDGKAEACTGEFLLKELKIDRTVQTLSDAHRAAAIFRQLGWDRDPDQSRFTRQTCSRIPTL